MVRAEEVDERLVFQVDLLDEVSAVEELLLCVILSLLKKRRVFVGVLVSESPRHLGGSLQGAEIEALKPA